jgi:magnesium chelatase family protein
MLAKRLPSILPPMTLKEALKQQNSQRSRKKTKEAGLIKDHFPVRHITARVQFHLLAAEVNPQPGEISLAIIMAFYFRRITGIQARSFGSHAPTLEDREVTISESKIHYLSAVYVAASMNQVLRLFQ